MALNVTVAVSEKEAPSSGTVNETAGALLAAVSAAIRNPSITAVVTAVVA